MGTSGGTATAARAAKAAIPAFAEANFFELRRGTSKISFTVSNIAGEPVLSYETQTFTGDEVHIETTEIGTLVTVTLSAIPDLERRLLTLVLPLVQVNPGTPEKVSVPVIFTRIEMSIAGRPLHPGPVQTYDVKVYTGKASFILS